MTFAASITFVTYLLLFVGAYWTVTHSLPVFKSLHLSRPKGWTLQAIQIRTHLQSQVAQMKRIRGALATPSRQNYIDPVDELRKRASSILAAGPHRGLQRWLNAKTHLNCDTPLRAAIAESVHSEATTATKYLEIASEILRPDWWRVHYRFNLITVLAPLIGLLGTMSGSQDFIVEYGETIAATHSMPPMSGLSDALMTTAIGLLLTVVAFLVVGVAAHVKRRCEYHLASATGDVVDAYRAWQKERGQFVTHWNMMETTRNGCPARR